jgi:hypothetical protein
MSEIGSTSTLFTVSEDGERMQKVGRGKEEDSCLVLGFLSSMRQCPRVEILSFCSAQMDYEGQGE